MDQTSKKQFVDHAPISNADIEPTLAKILGLKIASNGKLNGRILEEISTRRATFCSLQ